MDKKNFVDDFDCKIKEREILMPQDLFREDYKLSSCLTMAQTIKYLSWKYCVTIDDIVERCIDLGLPHCEEIKYENKLVVFVKKMIKKF